MLIATAPLTEFVSEIFLRLGTLPDIAHTVATHLVEANLKGHDSHGVGMVPAYVNSISQGLLKPNAELLPVLDQGPLLLLDSQLGFGQHLGLAAMQQGLTRVRQTGVVCLGLRNSHHLGRIGRYAEYCAQAGVISLHLVNVVGHEPQVAPFGGREARMTTNPFCCGIPRPGQPPLILDMATSAIALGKVRVAAMKGETVPAGSLIDAEGNPSTDPKVLFGAPKGALSPFGAHKGYGLAVVCELLAGALVGHWTAQPGQPKSGNIVNHMLSFLLDPAAFGDKPGFEAELEAMIAYLHSTAPAPGADRVRIPGEPELETQQQRQTQGIDLDSNSWQAICQAALRAGLSEAELPSGQ